MNYIRLFFSFAFGVLSAEASIRYGVNSVRVNDAKSISVSSSSGSSSYTIKIVLDGQSSFYFQNSNPTTTSRTTLRPISEITRLSSLTLFLTASKSEVVGQRREETAGALCANALLSNTEAFLKGGKRYIDLIANWGTGSRANEAIIPDSFLGVDAAFGENYGPTLSSCNIGTKANPAGLPELGFFYIVAQ